MAAIVPPATLAISALQSIVNIQNSPTEAVIKRALVPLLMTRDETDVLLHGADPASAAISLLCARSNHQRLDPASAARSAELREQIAAHQRPPAYRDDPPPPYRP